ncbi:hypothetical protein BHM03_00025798 [Ensete ventricosum]|nr:hypothetical protein BHM03_00025798 [Ensete ventricosum]
MCRMFNLGKIKFDGGAGSGSAVPSATGASASIVAVGSTTKKRPSVDEGLSLRKRNKRGTSEQITYALGSTTRVPAEKGKELVELKEAPEGGIPSESCVSPPRGGCVVVYKGGGTSRGQAEAEGLKAVTAYKASREFESSLKQMGRVSYEFGYRVALEQLRGKHPEIAIEQDLFAECPNDANMEMDLNQPFDDSTPSEK